jgi:hypothetical protein
MELDFAEVKPSLLNWVIIGLMACTFIVFAKWLLVKYPVRGLTDFIAAV